MKKLKHVLQASGGRALLSLLLVASSLAAQVLPSLAVADFEARGLPEHEATIIAERFRGQLVKSGLFKVMERGQMESILKEQGFQQSGACTDASCVVEIGQLLAVEKMVVGSVGKIGAMYTLNVKLIEIKTGEILLSHDEDVKGSVEDVLLQAVPAMSDKLVQEASSLRTMIGYLSVVSEPVGAGVTVGGNRIGTTPISGHELEVGQQKVGVTLENYAPQERTVTIAKGKTQDLSFTLSPTEEFLAEKKEEAKSKKSRLKGIVRWTSVGVTVIGAGLAGWYHMEWARKDAAYHATTDPGEAEALHRSIDQMEDFRLYSLILAGVGAVGLGVTIVF